MSPNQQETDGLSKGEPSGKQKSPLYNRTFAIAFLSQTGFVLANTLMSHYARWIDFLGGSVRQIGWVLGLGAIASLALRPWIGLWINRLGARNTWALGYALFGIGVLGNLLLYELNWLIYALRSCLALGSALVFSSSLTYITQSSPANRRTEAIGSLGIGGFIGMLAGPFLGDLMLGTGPRSRGNFTVLFVSATATLVLPALLLFFLPNPSKESRSSSVRLKDFLGTIRRYWPGTIAFVNMVFGICMTVPFGFLPQYIDERHLSLPGVSEIGLFFFCYAAMGMIVRIGLRRLPDRMGRRKVLLAGVITMGTGMLCFNFVDAAHAWWLCFPALCCGLGHGLMFHTCTALVIEPFPDKVRGIGSALSLTMLDLGLVAGAPILGHIAESYGYEWLFTTIAVSCFGAAGVYAYSSIPVWRERRSRRFAPASSQSGEQE